MRTFLALIGTLVCLVQDALSGQFPATQQELDATLMVQTTKLMADVASPVSGRTASVPFSQGDDLQTAMKTAMGKAIKLFQSKFVLNESYTLSIGIGREETVPDVVNGGTKVDGVPLKLWRRNLTFTGTVPEDVYDIATYGPPHKEFVGYLPVYDPLVKWVVVEEIYNGFQSRVIDTVNGSWPDGCWLQTDLAGNGFLYLPTFVFANDGVRREMTRYYDESRTLWRRTVIGTGDVVAVSNPPPPEPKPLRLVIAVMYGKTEVQITGDGAENAELQQSVDLVHWVPASSLSNPPTLTAKGVRKHSIIVGGDIESPTLYYRARASGGLQKL